MRSSYCRTFLAFLLKFLNFLQSFVGVSIIIYSVWLLNQWNKHSRIPPPSAPSPESFVPFLLNSDTLRIPDHGLPLNLAAGMVSGLEDGLLFDINNLPDPWFIYSFMGVGILLCSITCIGHIAAETINGCCLCFYTLLTIMLVLLEAALVAFVVFDHRWEKDLPNDPTGELESLRTFIEVNFGICKWVGVTVVIIQALSLLLATILRAMVSTRRGEYDSDDDYAAIRGKTRQPLLNPPLGQTSGSTLADSKAVHSDIWSTRMREKYGLNPGDVKYDLVDQNPLHNTNTSASSEDRRRCSIL